jgi:hypothetical protein
VRTYMSLRLEQHRAIWPSTHPHETKAVLLVFLVLASFLVYRNTRLPHCL